MNNPQTITYDGYDYDNEVAADLMDDEIREQLHADLAPCTDQVFFDAYLVAHREKYGDDFIIN